MNENIKTIIEMVCYLMNIASFLLGFISGVTGSMIHIFVIVRFLRKRGSGFFTGCINLHHYSELEKYKHLCLQEGRPLNVYYFVKKLWLISCVSIIIFALTSIVLYV